MEPSLTSACYRIEPMTIADIGDVLALWQGMPGLGLNESDTPVNLAKFLDRNARLSVVARSSDNRIVGAVLVSHDGRRGYLHHLAVAPAHRRHGLAREMVERSLASLHAESILKCNVFVYAHNEDGQHFWRACGWNVRSDLTMLQRMTQGKPDA